ncbi:MAG: ABC transporter ATP-binding protein, partial [Betaproteobacteria bacterium]
RDVAMVFQSYALYPHLTVFENMAVPLRMRRLGPFQRLPFIGGFLRGTRMKLDSISDSVQRVAAQLDIQPLLSRKPGQLSGGQRQRVAVGRAMVREPAAFLMDEPLSNLDAKLRVHMRTEIAQLHRTLATTFVYVTHDQAEAMTMSDRVAVMLGGRVLQVGTPDAIYHDPANLAVAEFVGSPRINLLNGRFDGECVRCPGGRIAVKLEVAAGQDVRIGFRCESATLAPDGEGDLRGEVAHLENLGSDVLVHIRVSASKAPVVIRTASSPGVGRFRVGDAIGVRTGHRLLAFDRDGARLGVLHTGGLDEATAASQVAHA